MAQKEHLKVIKKGSKVWNEWRAENPDIVPDLQSAELEGIDLFDANLRFAQLLAANLSGADLRQSDLEGATLQKADLRAAKLVKANLSGANCFRANFEDAVASETNLRGATLIAANLRGAILRRADLQRAHLGEADLRLTDFNGADLTMAFLDRAVFFGTMLRDANLSSAVIGWASFADVDLSTTKGLETVNHRGPSTIGLDTLYQSQGNIPDAFLRGAGVPEEFITQIPALVASVKPIQFQSCFISYSHRDEEFARRLHAAMRAENLRVWFAPEEMKGGKKLREQIYQAIQVHDRLLLVLSTDSMKSEWVMTEIRRAKKIEREEERRKLFPIRLVDFETIQNWECFDADSGKDLASEVREYYIPGFSNWKDHDSFEREFAKLLGALKATEK